MGKSAQVADCRAVNEALVLRALERSGFATKQELAQATGLSVMSVGTVVEQLAAAGRATARRRAAPGSGRPALEYCYNAGWAHVAALYTRARDGRDELNLCVTDLAGQPVLRRRAVPEEIGPDTFVPYVAQLVEKYPTIRALAFGLPGTQAGGVMACADYPALLGVRLAQRYRERFGLPVAVENDVNAAVRGYCALRGREDGCVGYLYFPEKYAPGAGFFLHGQVYGGAHGFAGEVGAMPPGLDWRALDYGSFAAACSAAARMVGLLCSVLDLDTLVLCGGFLRETHLREIRRQCVAFLAGPPPVLELSRDFETDYEAGVTAAALELLRPTARLIQEEV